MKKLVTLFKAAALLLLTFHHVATHAQLVCGLTMVPSSRTYTYISGGVAVDDIEADDAFKNGIPLGFTFVFGNCGNRAGYSSVNVTSNGILKFGTNISNSYPSSSAVGPANLPALWPLWGNLSGVGGEASYETRTLPTGNKVFTMEWKNWKWDNTATAANISFQVKLYEGSNIIEYCYKTEAGAIPASAIAMIGMGRTISATTAGCPGGFDYAIFQDASATPVFNTSGLIGAAIDAPAERPVTDQVFQFYYQCCGKPDAGAIVQPDSVCAGIQFTAKLAGATPAPFTAFGISYEWQAAPAATGPWTAIPLSNAPLFTFGGGIINDTFLRVVVTCAATGMTDTTDVHHIKLITLPYNCYCYSSAANNTLLPSLVNIGNVKVTTLDGTKLIDTGLPPATPSLVFSGPYRDYTLWTALRPIPEINRDSTYKWSVKGVTTDTFAFSPTGVGLYIDYNGDNTYNATSELAAFQVLSGTTTSFTANFTVPTTATLNGFAGLRVVMQKGATVPAMMDPCAGYAEGETEDYLVQISNPPCSGPLVAGTSYIADTSICPGYKTLIRNTTHAKNLSAMHWQWEYSLDNILWADVSGGRNVDSLKPVVRQTTWYRLRMVCEKSSDTIYSNKVFIKLKQPYKCYCYSVADGNDGPAQNDSADITTVKLHDFEMNTGGPHLLNVNSVRMRTDYTHLAPIELVAGKSYPIAVYHTLFGKYHSDARISVFMDFNHNLAYDAASERIWTATTSATDYFPHDMITIPLAVIYDEALGMRVVLNSSPTSGTASDDACGAFTSGEIEDYLVIFRKPSTGIPGMSNIDNLQIFPNPANGLFTISFAATTAINEASVAVTNITGQKVMSEHYSNPGASFNRTINLSGQAPGVYFITLTVDGQSTVRKMVLR